MVRVKRRYVGRSRGEYMAQMGAEGRNVYLGCYDTAEEASAAYQAGQAAKQKGRLKTIRLVCYIVPSIKY